VGQEFDNDGQGTDCTIDSQLKPSKEHSAVEQATKPIRNGEAPVPEAT
jgi:hypothetical protein